MTNILALTFAFLASPPGQSPLASHDANPILAAVLGDGLSVGGAKFALPASSLRDDLDEAARKAILLDVAGSEQALEGLLRDSVTAPFVLRTRDEKAEGATIRVLDLWFVVHGDLKEIDARKLAEQSAGRAVEAGNMRFESRLIGDPGESGWRTRLSGLLLGRIGVDVTSEVAISQTDKSLVIASRTDATADPESNRWWPVAPGGEKGEAHPFAGGISYARVSRLAAPEGALLVEMHAAFAEPDGWFKGAPILRSKFAPIAQDQIRRFRSELATARKVPTPDR